MKKYIYISIILISVISVVILKTVTLKNDTVLPVINIHLKSCQVQQQSCQAELDELELIISFARDVFYLKPFHFSVKTKVNADSEIASVKINFKMKNMNMGVNQFSLKKTNTNNNEQQWQGTALLPVCVTGRADWFSELEVVTNKSRYIVSFPITVKQAEN